jgi:hypothetical protein
LKVESKRKKKDLPPADFCLKCIYNVTDSKVSTQMTFSLEASRVMFLRSCILAILSLAVVRVISAGQSHGHVNNPQQSADSELHPYFEEPIDQLVKRIPELKGIRPATDQRELSTILRKTGATVDEFFANIVDLIAREDITQERLVSGTVDGGMPGGLIGTSKRLRDSYLILRQVAGDRAEVNEFRMNDQGIRVVETGPDKGFFMTSGFALSSVHFSTVDQWDSRFLHLGEQKIFGRETHVIAFAQLPSEARNSVTMKAAEFKTNMFIQGIAWVDQAGFQIVRMRTDLLAPQADIGLEEQTTKISFTEVRFPDVAVPLWLPRDVNVYMKFTAGAPVQIFRNVHRYSDYRRYRVSTKILAP